MNDDPKDSPKDRRRERTRKEILAAAAEVFARKGFHEATIQEIARVAALSAGSLYNYFDNKEALFSDLMDDVHESFEKILVPPPPELDFDDQLRQVVATLFRFGEEYRDHFRFFMLLHWSGGLSLGRDMGIKSQAQQEMLGRYVFGLLVAAKERGQLDFADPETATLLVLPLAPCVRRPRSVSRTRHLRACTLANAGLLSTVDGPTNTDPLWATWSTPSAPG